MKLMVVVGALALALAAAAAETPAVEAVLGGKTPPRLSGDYTAAQVIAACRDMLPRRAVELTGALIVRNRKGIVSDEYGYRLVMRQRADDAQVKIDLTPRNGTNLLATVSILRRATGRPEVSLRQAGKSGVETASSPLDAVLGTDVTWLDLTFDFLWWTNAEFEANREGESVHGQQCAVILVRPPQPIAGLGAVRLWTDKKTGCMMQAEQLDERMEPLRRIWGTRVKKFNDRWMVSVLEAETPGKRHRTKITVESLRDVE